MAEKKNVLMLHLMPAVKRTCHISPWNVLGTYTPTSRSDESTFRRHRQCRRTLRWKSRRPRRTIGRGMIIGGSGGGCWCRQRGGCAGPCRVATVTKSIQRRDGQMDWKRWTKWPRVRFLCLIHTVYQTWWSLRRIMRNGTDSWRGQDIKL